MSFRVKPRDDVFITTEVGQHQMWAAQFYKCDESYHWLSSGGAGTITQLWILDNDFDAASTAAIGGTIPVSIFPRWNFLLLAANQLVNHLDKLPIYSNGGYRPKVIIRTAVATDQPLDPGPQHLGDYSGPFAEMLATVRVARLAAYYEYDVALMNLLAICGTPERFEKYFETTY